MESKARLIALEILGRRNMSASEMKKRLMQKGLDEQIVEETLEWLTQSGLIDDREYAAQIVRHYSGKGYGMHRIRDELYRRGIEREMWDEALSGLEDMDKAALSFLIKKLRGSDDKDDLRRAVQAMYRRGFDRDEVDAAVRKYKEENYDL